MGSIVEVLEASSPPRVFQIDDLVEHAIRYPGEMRVPPFAPNHLIQQITELAKDFELLGVVTNATVWSMMRKIGRGHFEVTTKVFQLKAGIMAYWMDEPSFPVGVSRKVEGNVVYAIKKGGECIAWKVMV